MSRCARWEVVERHEVREAYLKRGTALEARLEGGEGDASRLGRSREVRVNRAEASVKNSKRRAREN